MPEQDLPQAALRFHLSMPAVPVGRYRPARQSAPGEAEQYGITATSHRPLLCHHREHFGPAPRMWPPQVPLDAVSYAGATARSAVKVDPLGTAV